VLLNDWSGWHFFLFHRNATVSRAAIHLIASDILTTEMPPLSPLNSKSLGTAISPWIINTAALEPFKVPAHPHTLGGCLHLIRCQGRHVEWGVISNYALTSFSSGSKITICNAKIDWMHLAYKYMVRHQAINNCQLRMGGLFGTGTVSGGRWAWMFA